MKKYLLLLFTLLHFSDVSAQFTTIWKTDNSGVTSSTQIRIPVTGTNYDIRWQKVGEPAVNGAAIGNNTMHTLNFPSPGLYQVEISPGSGTVSSIAFSNTGDALKLMEITKWGNIQWTTMWTAFYGCENLRITATDVPDMSQVPSMISMFNNCRSLTSIPSINDWNVGNVTNMKAMFQGATNFDSPIGNWNVSKVSTMESMFQDATSFNQDISNWSVGSVVDMQNMFQGATNFTSNLNNWNVSNVTNMNYMFNKAKAFNSSLNSWNTSNVTNMKYMFAEASAFNGAIANWNVSNVTNMQFMFYKASAFDQPIGTWIVNNVTDMQFMFYEAFLFNQPLHLWNVSNVTNMRDMFYNAYEFNGNISDWNVSNVTNMKYMFYGTQKFNQSLGLWNVGKVTDMEYMFHAAKVFNQPIRNWDVSKVTTMRAMFANSESFNQPLGNWDLSSLTRAEFMLIGSNMDCFNMTSTLNGWAANSLTPNNVIFDASGIDYAAEAIDALNILENNKGWTIKIGEEVACTESLPVTLISFTATGQEKRVHLEWSTTTEQNHAYFEIERTTDIKKWVPLARIEGKGNTNERVNYDFVDPTSLNNVVYYRLKIVATSGEIEYSKIVSVHNQTDQKQYAYPNPAIDHLLTEGLPIGTTRIYNSLGQLVQLIEMTVSQNAINIQNLPMGKYMLVDSKGEVLNFIKH